MGEERDGRVPEEEVRGDHGVLVKVTAVIRQPVVGVVTVALRINSRVENIPHPSTFQWVARKKAIKQEERLAHNILLCGMSLQTSAEGVGEVGEEEGYTPANFDLGLKSVKR